MVERSIAALGQQLLTVQVLASRRGIDRGTLVLNLSVLAKMGVIKLMPASSLE